MDLSIQEAVGIALAVGHSTEDVLGDRIDHGTWERLHGYGYIKVVRDFMGEGTVVATPTGREALTLALSRVRSDTEDPQ